MGLSGLTVHDLDSVHLWKVRSSGETTTPSGFLSGSGQDSSRPWSSDRPTGPSRWPVPKILPKRSRVSGSIEVDSSLESELFLFVCGSPSLSPFPGRRGLKKIPIEVKSPDPQTTLVPSFADLS